MGDTFRRDDVRLDGVGREGEAPAEPRVHLDPRLGSAGASPSQESASPSPESASASPESASASQGNASPSQEDALPSHPVRKHPAHGVHIVDGKPTIVFLTVCTKNRGRWLATHEFHDLLREVWTNATAWLTGRYIILPDHLHLFAAPGTPEISLKNWVKYWESQFHKKHKRAELKFQTDHWDTRLRSHESYEQKWEYVRNNAVRHGLVERAEDWPFQGEIFELRWD